MAKAHDQFANFSPTMRIVILFGKESLLLAEGSARLGEVLRESFGEIDIFTFDGIKAELSDVLDELRTYALIQHHKLVIVDNADKFLAESDDEDSDGNAKKSRGGRRRRAMEDYAQNPVPDATLLLRAESWRPGKLDKLVAKVGTKIKCDLLSDIEAARWCVQRCPTHHGKTLQRPAATLLVQRLGAGLARLDQELAKLAAFVGSKETIGRSDVVEMVGYSREEKAWELQSAMVAGSPGDAVAKLRELLDVSQLPEQLIMWAIGDLLRRIHTAAQMLRQGIGTPSIARQLKLWGHTGESIIDVARRCDPNRIAQLLQLAVRTDARSKSGFGRAGRNLEALTVLVADTIRDL